jgi:putative membrane protein
MKGSKYIEKVLKRSHLTEEDLDNIKKTVNDAEKNTNGEIALALTPASHDYSFWELLFSLFAGIVVFCVMLPFSGDLARWGESHLWAELPEWYLPGFFGAILVIVIGIVFALVNIPVIDRLIIPKDARTLAVTRRTARHFTESGVYATKENSGILIFISLLEREVRIVADFGISSKIDQLEWDALAAGLVSGFNYKNNKITAGEAVIKTVEKCGKLLAEHFPPLAENPNELNDGLVILPSGE